MCNHKVYDPPVEFNSNCTCQKEITARYEGIKAAREIIYKPNVQKAIIELMDKVEKTHCNVCKALFKSGFFEEKQRREEVLQFSKNEKFNVRI